MAREVHIAVHHYVYIIVDVVLGVVKHDDIRHVRFKFIYKLTTLCVRGVVVRTWVMKRLWGLVRAND